MAVIEHCWLRNLWPGQEAHRQQRRRNTGLGSFPRSKPCLGLKLASVKPKAKCVGTQVSSPVI